MSKSAYRWLVIVSFVVPALFMIGDATIFAHLIPPEIRGIIERRIEQQSADGSWGTLVFALFFTAVLVALPVNMYGLLRFKPWAPKFSIWFSVLSYVLVPFMGVSVHSGLSAAAMALGSMLWGIVVVLPYASPQVRSHFWPSQHSHNADTAPTSHEVSNG